LAKVDIVVVVVAVVVVVVVVAVVDVCFLSVVVAACCLLLRGRDAATTTRCRCRQQTLFSCGCEKLAFFYTYDSCETSRARTRRISLSFWATVICLIVVGRGESV
jgi:hypothetical protein